MGKDERKQIKHKLKRKIILEEEGTNEKRVNKWGKKRENKTVRRIKRRKGHGKTCSC
jgi:hypothetical protein